MPHSIPDYTLAEAALNYAEAGLAVLPLRPNRKEPLGRLVRHGVKNASADPVIVSRWWNSEPNANIGIRTGNGLAVIDVDPRNGGKLDPSWPTTLTAETASGGWHLYYSVDGDLRTSHSGIAPGVDVKSEGGYVVAPPSTRGSGSWKWDSVAPLVSIRASVLQPVRSARVERSQGRSDYQRFEPLDVIPEGQRHSELTRWAGWLRAQGYCAVEIDEVLASINNLACNPPLSEDEVDGIAGWAGALPS
jgi:hypothetical protein